MFHTVLLVVPLYLSEFDRRRAVASPGLYATDLTGERNGRLSNPSQHPKRSLPDNHSFHLQTNDHAQHSKAHPRLLRSCTHSEHLVVITDTRLHRPSDFALHSVPIEGYTHRVARLPKQSR